MATVQGATDEQGKSAGTFDPGDRAAARCSRRTASITEEGFARIAKREYNLFSPWFRTITDDDRTSAGRYELLNVAFVNLAGLNDLQAIASAARRRNRPHTQARRAP